MTVATPEWIPNMPVALGDRRGFPRLAARAYLAHCAISPVSLGVQRAISMLVDDYAARGIEAFMTWHERREGLRRSAAALIGAQSVDIGFVANTTAGVSTIAQCLPWRPGAAVLVLRGEFPTNVTPWQQAARAHDVRVDWLDVADFHGASGSGLSQLETRLKQDDVQLIAVSAVQFQTGLRMPIAEMATLAHRYGAELFCDAIQAVGALEIDVAGDSVDYLVAGSHKWMMGLEGCALLYVSPQCVADLRPNVAGWLSHEDPVEFLFAPGKLDYQRPIRRRADFVEAGAYPAMQLAALETAISYIHEIGVPAIEAHVTAYLDRVERGACALGYVSLRSEVAAQRSGILSLQVPAGVDLASVHAHLGSCGIVTTMPDGVLRIAPHWPNALDETGEVVAALASAVREPSSQA